MGNGKGEEGSWLNWEGCFACGKKNPWGLKLQFEKTNENLARARVIFHENYVGYPGIVHGGIVTTVLDEAMAKALLLQDIIAFTVEISVRFRKKAEPGREYLVEGWVEEKKRNIYFTGARLMAGEIEIASARGKFFALNPSKLPERE